MESLYSNYAACLGPKSCGHQRADEVIQTYRGLEFIGAGSSSLSRTNIGRGAGFVEKELRFKSEKRYAGTAQDASIRVAAAYRERLQLQTRVRLSMI